MAYEVTATRRRPQIFDQLVGQEFVVATLKSSMESQRVAHAYLFSGPRGVGKTSAARILAKSLNCLETPGATPCGTCTNCQEISRGNSLDVIEIDGASNTSVNDVREIKDEVLFSPTNSRYKVYIIDEVHMLSNSAFNALLKTIEEPPPYIVFVFATTEVHKVPATIRSRCQQFNFRLIPLEDIKEQLTSVCSENGIGAEDEALFWIAKEATGSLRDAFTLFDQVVAFSDGQITLEKIRRKLGLVGLDELNAIASLLVDRDAQAALERTNDVIMKGVSIEQFVIDLAEYFRALLFLKHGVRKESVLGYAPSRFPEHLPSQFTAQQLEQAVAWLFQLYRNLRSSLNQRFELELLLSRLCTLQDRLSNQEIVSALRSMKAELLRGGGTPSSRSVAASERSVGPETESGSVSRRPVATNTGAPEDDGNGGNQPEDPPRPTGRTSGAVSTQHIEAILSGLQRSKLALSSALQKADEWRLEESTLVISFSTRYLSDVVQSDLSTVTEKARESIAPELTVRIETREDAETPEPSGDREETNVDVVRRVFRGEVIQGEE